MTNVSVLFWSGALCAGLWTAGTSFSEWDTLKLEKCTIRVALSQH
jgi:hypothetical protein